MMALTKVDLLALALCDRNQATQLVGVLMIRSWLICSNNSLTLSYQWVAAWQFQTIKL